MPEPALVSDSKTKASNLLTRLASKCYDGAVMSPETVMEMMRARLAHDVTRRKEVEKEMAQLASAYNRYVDLRNQLAAHIRSAERLKGIMGTMNVRDIELSFPTDGPRSGEIDALLRHELELWEIIEEYLQFVPEARVREILEFLEHIELSTSRQAVEAAIKSRPKKFTIRKRKGENIVSLKK